MTIYVDPLYAAPHGTPVAHLWTDGDAEALDDFAWELGIMKALTGAAEYVAWGVGRRRARHYRITAHQRRLALVRGAVRLDMTDFYQGNWERQP